MNLFRESQNEATFILISIDVTDGLGPMREADHRENLIDAKAIMRGMAVTLGSITRNDSNLVTSKDIVSLDDLLSRRQVCLRYLDERSEVWQEEIKNAFGATEEVVDVAIEDFVDMCWDTETNVKRFSGPQLKTC